MADPERLDQLFDEALRHPAPSYALGHRLATLFPELAMLETDSPLFDVRAFASGKQCSYAEREQVFQQYSAHFKVEETATVRAPRVVWWNVSWGDVALQIVTLSVAKVFGDEQRHYVLGRDQATCAAFFEAVCKYNHQVRGEILVYRDHCFTKSAKLFETIAATRFEQLVLESGFKEQIREDFERFLSSRTSYEEHGVPWKRGALFIGPPGNGKTLCVKALIRLLAIPCIYVQSFDSPQGTSQAGIEQVFQRARETTPCILVLEDIDALLVEGTRSFFLNELDGFAANTGVITLATTNHPERLDPSVVERPSRFDRKYHFGLPSEPTRAEYIALWNRRLQPGLQLSDAGCARLAAITDGFSFAYIQEVFVSSMMRWMATRDPAGISTIAHEQVELLRAQMKS